MYSRIVYYFVSFLILLITTAGPTYAYDKEVVCNSSGCGGFSGALFSETDVKPGDTYNKSFCIKNDRDENLSITMTTLEKAGADLIFKEVLEVIVKDNTGSILYQGSLKNFLNTQNNLGKISEDQTKCYDITLNFPSSAGNEYQKNQVGFDLIIRITGDDSGEVLPNSTSSSNSNNSASSLQNILGSVLGLANTGNAKTKLALMLFEIILITLGIKELLQKNKITSED